MGARNTRAPQPGQLTLGDMWGVIGMRQDRREESRPHTGRITVNAIVPRCRGQTSCSSNQPTFDVVSPSLEPHRADFRTPGLIHNSTTALNGIRFPCSSEDRSPGPGVPG